MDICGVKWDRVVCDSREFLQVHAELPFPYDYPKVFDFFLFKGTLFGFQVEVVGF